MGSLDKMREWFFGIEKAWRVSKKTLDESSASASVPDPIATDREAIERLRKALEDSGIASRVRIPEIKDYLPHEWAKDEAKRTKALRLLLLELEDENGFLRGEEEAG